jgi:hexokinase
MERVCNISKLGSTHANQDGGMILNTEWGAFCDAPGSLHLSRFDRELDSTSTNPGSQALEKQISGLYLGEILRLALLHLLSRSLLDMVVAEDSPLYTPYAIDTSFLSTILAIGADQLHAISSTLKAHQVSLSDAHAAVLLATGIMKRSARLSGACIAAIIIQSGRLHPGDPQSRSKCQSVVSEKDVSQKKRSRGKIISAIVFLRKILHKLFGCIRIWKQQQLLVTADMENQSLVAESGSETPIIDVGVDGSLYEFCPNFEAYIRETLREIPQIGEDGERRIKIGLAKDGSSVGAALVAAMVE